MTTALWAFAGGILGWIGYSFLGLSQVGGKGFSILLGAMGGVVGGKLIAPMFVDATPVASAFSLPALLVAIAVSGALLGIGSLVYKRWGV